MQAAQVISLEKRSALEIHNEAMTIAHDLKSQYVKLFEILLVVESRRLYYEFDVPSLFIYCVELLGLSRATAQDFICVVRKSLEVPELANALRDGKITISKARKICSVLTPASAKQWIDLAIHCSCREVERTVAMTNPREAAHESMKYVTGDVLEFKLGVSEEWSELLKRTKDLLSQKERRAVSSEDALYFLMSEYCRKNDPVEKAKRTAKRAEKETCDKPTAGSNDVATLRPSRRSKPENSNARTRYRPAKIEHEVDLRDGGQCTFVDSSGTRCESRRWLEKHHIAGFAGGGDHSLENLVTHCSSHHAIVHLKAKGPGKSMESSPSSNRVIHVNDSPRAVEAT